MHSFEESWAGTSVFWNVCFVAGFFLILDFILFWKHYLLHTPTLFYFHSNHHSFGNPTAFASFAVSPVETLFTFGPVLFDLLPIANEIKLYWPYHAGIIGFFTVLNIYLHCGYTFDWVEKTLPMIFLNTSAYHNVHHEKKIIHFAELLTLWDCIKNTGGTVYNKTKFAEKLKTLKHLKLL